MQYICYVVTAISIIATLANAYKKRWCFIVWLFTNAFWAIYDFANGIYPQAILFTVYFIISVIGLRKWRNNK